MLIKKRDINAEVLKAIKFIKEDKGLFVDCKPVTLRINKLYTEYIEIWKCYTFIGLKTEDSYYSPYC